MGDRPALLVWVRHGESIFNAERKAIARGELDAPSDELRRYHNFTYPLSEQGRAQADRIGRHLSAEFGQFDRAFTSPMRRARETADAILRHFDPRPEPIVEDRIRERDPGVPEGMVRAETELARILPGESRRREWEGRYYYRPPGGENFSDVGLRIHSFLETLVDEHDGERLLVVTHAAVIAMARKLIERLSPEEALAFDETIEVGSITVYTDDPDQNRLVLERANQVV